MYTKILLCQILIIFYLNTTISQRVAIIDEDWFNSSMVKRTLFFRTKIMFEGTGIQPAVIPFRPYDTFPTVVDISGRSVLAHEAGVLDDSLREKVHRVNTVLTRNQPLWPVFFEVEYFKGQETLSDLYYIKERDYNHTDIFYIYWEMKQKKRLPYNWCKFFEVKDPIFLLQFMAYAPEQHVDISLESYAKNLKPFKTLTFIEERKLYIDKGTVLAFRCDAAKTKEIKNCILIGVLVLCVLGLLMGIHAVLHEIYLHKNDAH